jgi:multiple sugar transport system permease protein
MVAVPPAYDVMLVDDIWFAEFTGRYVVDVTGMMTGGVLAAIPPILLALIFQRYIVSGLTSGAVKG